MLMSALAASTTPSWHRRWRCMRPGRSERPRVRRPVGDGTDGAGDVGGGAAARDRSFQ